MSLWTRLIYGVPNMEAWYQQNPTHKKTIEYYTNLCKTNELPAINSTKKMKKVAQEDIKIAKRLNNNSTFLDAFNKTVKEGEEYNFEII